MCFGVSGKTAEALCKNRDVNSSHEPMPIIDIEDQNATASIAFLLGSIRRAEVEIARRRRFTQSECGDEKTNCNPRRSINTWMKLHR